MELCKTELYKPAEWTEMHKMRNKWMALSMVRMLEHLAVVVDNTVRSYLYLTNTQVADSGSTSGSLVVSHRMFPCNLEYIDISPSCMPIEHIYLPNNKKYVHK